MSASSLVWAQSIAVLIVQVAAYRDPCSPVDSTAHVSVDGTAHVRAINPAPELLRPLRYYA